MSACVELLKSAFIWRFCVCPVFLWEAIGLAPLCYVSHLLSAQGALWCFALCIHILCVFLLSRLLALFDDTLL